MENKDKIFKYALNNWDELVKNASTSYTKTPIPISQQLRNKFHCSIRIADEIANSISISMSILRSVK